MDKADFEEIVQMQEGYIGLQQQYGYVYVAYQEASYYAEQSLSYARTERDRAENLLKQSERRKLWNIRLLGGLTLAIILCIIGFVT